MALTQRPEITVAQYLASVPTDRRAALQTVRGLVDKHLPKGYEQGTGLGMIVRNSTTSHSMSSPMPSPRCR